MMTIIGLTGYARTGKDTVGDILVRNHGFTRVAFADKLKELALAIDPQLRGAPLQGYGLYCGHETGSAEWWDVAKTFPQVREFLQNLGSACRTTFSEDFWVDAAFNDLGFGPPGMRFSTPIVITDVRYLNEAQAIHDRGGQVWRINRPDVGPANNHASETELDRISADKSILNAGTIDDLEHMVRRALARTTERRIGEQQTLWAHDVEPVQ